MNLLFEHLGSSPIPPIAYALTMVGIFGSLNAVWRYAYRHGLRDPVVDEPLYRLILGGTRAPWLIFLLSVPLALFSADLATYSWILILALGRIFHALDWRRYAAAQVRREAAAEKGAPAACGRAALPTGGVLD